MKWKCTYRSEEEGAALGDLSALLRRHPGAKVRKKSAKPPQKVLYLTSKNPGKADGAEEKP